MSKFTYVDRQCRKVDSTRFSIPWNPRTNEVEKRAEERVAVTLFHGKLNVKIGLGVESSHSSNNSRIRRSFFLFT